jgi:hypothetical protein
LTSRLITVLLYLVGKLLLTMLPPMLAHALRLSSEGLEPPDWCHPILSLSMGRRRLQTTHLGVWGPQVWQPALIWKIWVLGLSRLPKGSLPYQRGLTCCHSDYDDYACSHGRVPMPGIDGLETSARVPLYQVHIGACGYVPSRRVLSSVTYQEPGC